MQQFIRINNNNKCSRISFDAIMIDIEKWKLQYLEDGELLIDVEGATIPECSIEELMYDRETKEFFQDHSKKTPDRTQALNSLEEFTASEILEMGLDYILLVNAINIGHLSLINQLLVKIDTASYMASEKVRLILEESNFIVISGEALPPF